MELSYTLYYLDEDEQMQEYTFVASSDIDAKMQVDGFLWCTSRPGLTQLWKEAEYGVFKEIDL